MKRPGPPVKLKAGQKKIVAATAAFVERTLGRDATGHDWLHALRVLRNARRIAAAEPAADLYLVELGALLHDIADWKFHGGDLAAGPRRAAAWLKHCGAGAVAARRVAGIIAGVSFKGAGVADTPGTLEGRIVQDADRLDAIGAIGVARAFAYGGAKGRELYNPAVKPVLHASAKAYRQGGGPTLNHFHEKLVLLKDRMRTAEGRRLAAARHRFMLRFLSRFAQETGPAGTEESP